MKEGATQQKKELLQRYFANHDEVVLAYLFGSRARGEERPQSDWDVAVYLRQENEEVTQSIWSSIERILESETDLVILNRAPATLVWEIIRSGEPLCIKDRTIYLDTLLRSSEEADAFYRTSREYVTVFERSNSLSEPDRRRVMQLITFLEEEVRDYGMFRALSWKEYSQNRSKKREVERWIELLVTAMVDVAKIIVASERRAIPATYRTIVEELGSIADFGIDDLALKLARWTGLRNILAHEYLDLRWKNISAFIAETESVWTAFITRTKEFVNQE